MRAAAAVGAEYAGVDLLPARDGTVSVLEVNGIPGWRGLQEATGLDVAGALVDQLTSPGFRMIAGRHRGRGPAGLPAGSERAQAGQRLAGPSLSRHAVRGLPGERRGDRAGARRGGQPAAREPPSRRRSTRPHGGPVRTPTSASSSSSRRWRAPHLARAAISASRLARVLDETTVDDAAEVYAAIRLARPGGLGRRRPRTWPARRASRCARRWRLAADRDAVAREYVTDFTDDVRGRRAGHCEPRGSAGLPWSDATVEGYLSAPWRAGRHPHRRGSWVPTPPKSIEPGARGSGRRGVDRRPGRGDWRRSTPSCETRATAATRARPRT